MADLKKILTLLLIEILQLFMVGLVYKIYHSPVLEIEKKLLN